MPQLNITMVTVEPDYDALLPTIKFRIQIANETPAETITLGILEYDVYLLKGNKSLWLGRSTLRLPTSEHVPLIRTTEIVENFGLPIDVTNAMFEYLKTVEEEDITFQLKFRCSYYYRSGGTLMSSYYFAGDTPELSKHAKLPIDKWKRLISTFYRNLTWIAISRETYSLLKERADREGATLDEVIKKSLSGGK
ncbi:MAG: DUF6084 family protein [Candidatus Bathyarchaeia archaeon]